VVSGVLIVAGQAGQRGGPLRQVERRPCRQPQVKAPAAGGAPARGAQAEVEQRLRRRLPRP